MKHDVSIIIVSYNTCELTLACLRSLYHETRDITFEVIVVDNASSDGSADAIAAEFPQARLMLPGENLGFARANNLAAEQAGGEYLLLLNPDTVVLDGALQTLHAFARQHPEAAIFGGRTLYADGSLNPTSCWGRPTPWSTFCRAIGLSAIFKGNRLFDPETLGGWARDTVRQVDIVTGCLFLIRKELWEQLGGFAPEFFMYGEEADLCLRAQRLGSKCLICPQATIIHYDGASERVRSDRMVRLFRSKAQLFARHWGTAMSRFGVAMLNWWAFTRMVAFGLLTHLGLTTGKQNYPAWRTIWRRRAEWNDVNSQQPAMLQRQYGVLALPRFLVRKLYRRMFRNSNYVFVCDSMPKRVTPAHELRIDSYQNEKDLPADLLAQLREAEGQDFVDVIKHEFSRHGQLWLGLRNDQVAAYQWTRKGQHVQNWFVELGDRDLVIFNTATLPRFRGQGINPYIMGHIIEQHVQKGGRVLIDCKEWNTPAIRANEKVGFRLIGKMKPLHGHTRHIQPALGTGVTS